MTNICMALSAIILAVLCNLSQFSWLYLLPKAALPIWIKLSKLCRRQRTSYNTSTDD